MRDLTGSLTRAVWEYRRPEVIAWLRLRGFTPKAAALACDSFIETMVYVAYETDAIRGEKP
jgi:hypothetical protein